MELEQLMDKSLGKIQQRKRVYTIGDLESLSASALYTGDLPPMSMGGFKLPKEKSQDKVLDISGYPTNSEDLPVPIKIVPLANSGITIPYGNLGINELKDMHDTFNVDRYGNLYDGHTTVDNKFKINIDFLKLTMDLLPKK